MELPKPQPALTIEEYLAFERASRDRHEYVDGQLRGMAGESGAHGDITVNIVISLGTQLKGKSCRLRTKDTKVRSGPIKPSGPNTSGFFSYPDIVVVCGEPEYHDTHTDVILNPTTIVEVLSQSTEAFDRGEKFTRYQMWNPSLKDYVLVSQDQAQIEHYIRQDDGSWIYRRITGLGSSAVISSIQCTLHLSEVYDRIHFADNGLPDPRP